MPVYGPGGGTCDAHRGRRLLTALGTLVDRSPGVDRRRTGIGFGSRDYPFPNYTRALLLDAGNSAVEDVSTR